MHPGAFKTGSSVKVINGSHSDDDNPKALFLTLYDKDKKYYGTCTGSFISDQLLMTAAHCTMSEVPDSSGSVPDLGYIRVSSPTGVFKDRPQLTSVMKHHSDYKATAEGNADWGPDIGFAVFAPKTAPNELIETIATAEPKVGDSVSLTGYGYSTLSAKGFEGASGKKFSGKNTIAKLLSEHNDAIETLINSTSAADSSQNAGAAAGDSGASLLNDKGEAIGIVHGPDWDASQNKPNNYASVYGNLSNQAFSSYVSQMKGENHADVSNLPQDQGLVDVYWRLDKSAATSGDTCVPIAIFFMAAPGAVEDKKVISVNLSTQSSSGAFYAQSGCNSDAITKIDMPPYVPGSSRQQVYYRDNSGVSTQLTATETPSQGWQNGTVNVTIP